MLHVHADVLMKYKLYKNKLTSIIRYSEKMYYNKLLEKHKNDIKSTWRVLNCVIKKNINETCYPKEFEHNGIVISQKSEIANKFNEFFVNVGPDLAKNIKVCDNANIYDYLSNRNCQSMFLESVSEKEIIDIVNSFKSKTSTGYDNIDMSIVKKNISHIAKPLMKICNQSFMQGIFPDRMKIAKVIPLFKSGAKGVFTNYRPVSLLPQFSKLLEKLFCSRLDKFISKSNILCESQYGFRSNRSTSLAIIDLIENISSMLDQRKSTIGIFVDLKKAFDTIDHNIMLKNWNSMALGDLLIIGYVVT